MIGLCAASKKREIETEFISDSEGVTPDVYECNWKQKKFIVYYVKHVESFMQQAIDTRQNVLVSFTSYSLNLEKSII